MLKIIVLKIDENFPFENYLHWFNQKSQAKINTYYFKIDKVRAFASELLKYYYLAKIVGVKPRDIQINHNDLGKPYFLLNKQQHIDFSISHSGEYVAMAISYDNYVRGHEPRVNVGIDIEKIDPKIKPQELAKLVFSPSEQSLIRDDPDKFFLLWTKKEALFKARGTGFINDYYMSTSLTADIFEEGRDYMIYSSKFMPDYYLSCCATVIS